MQILQGSLGLPTAEGVQTSQTALHKQNLPCLYLAYNEDVHQLVCLCCCGGLLKE